MYDLIGDIHGQSEKLIYLLKKLGYQNTTQGFQHPENKVVFVGDFIDRGPNQLATLNIVHEMVESGNAYAIMGNHEFNAIGWATKLSEQHNEYLRPHNTKNLHQHRAFLDAVDDQSELHHKWINWFKSLPLFLELSGIRVIHACWDQNVINDIRPFLNSNNSLPDKNIQLAFDQVSPLFDLCEILLKGKELELPNGINYTDKDGHIRHRTRIRWWVTDAKYLSEICLIPDAQLKSLPKQAIDTISYLYQSQIPIFFGHYWFTGKPAILSPKIACLDYSAAINDNKLVAYRWQGETDLTNQHFVW